MVSIKQALNSVKQEFDIFFPNQTDFRLEEIDTFDSDVKYDLTVSFLLPEVNPIVGFSSGINSFRKYVRLYKKVSFDKSEGKIISIKNPIND